MIIKPLHIIHTWQKDHENGANDMCRGTYIYTWGYFLDHRFVFDNTRKLEDLLPDEVRVDVDSGMFNTAFKTKLALQLAYDRGYSHVFYTPTDCYVIVPRLFRNLKDHVEAGHHYWGFHTYDEWHIGGGSGYWLSRRGMEACLQYNVYPDYEDRWVGSACRAAGLEAIHDELYRSVDQPYMARSVTTHLSTATGQYDPEVMKVMHMQTIMGAKYQSEGPHL